MAKRLTIISVTRCRWITSAGKRWATCCHYKMGLTCKGYRKCHYYEPLVPIVVFDRPLSTEGFPGKVLLDFDDGITYSHAEAWNNEG